MPGCGKTTVIRDIARQVSSAGKRKVCIVDERDEITAFCKGQPKYNIGDYTDIFSSYPKKYAIESAIRCMTPEYIICDELGNTMDADSIKFGQNCGVKFGVTMHGKTIDDVKSRLDYFNCSNCFNKIFLLNGIDKPGTLQKIELI